jgi:hypothetical protein
MVVILLFTLSVDAGFGQVCGFCDPSDLKNSKLSFRDFDPLEHKYEFDKEALKNQIFMATSTRGDGTIIFHFIRLDSLGNIFISCGHCSNPTKEELSNSQMGTYGYYGIKNGRITVKTWTRQARKYYIFGRINDSELNFEFHKRRKIAVLKVMRPERIFRRLLIE